MSREFQLDLCLSPAATRRRRVEKTSIGAEFGGMSVPLKILGDSVARRTDRVVRRSHGHKIWMRKPCVALERCVANESGVCNMPGGRCLPAISERGQISLRTWCGRRESNPHRPFEPCGFSYRLRLSPPGADSPRESASGLRSGLSLHRPSLIRGIGAARLVSTPSRLNFSPGLARDFHCEEVSPNLGSSASPVSRRALKFFSSPLRLPFRHARLAV